MTLAIVMKLETKHIHHKQISASDTDDNEFPIEISERNFEKTFN